MRQKKSTKRSHNTKKIALIASTIVVVVIAVAAWFISPLFLEKASADAIIRIPHNADKEMLHDSITKYLGNKYSSHVMRSLALAGYHPEERHGAFQITHGTSPLRAARRLAKGAQTPLTLTINGFRSVNTLAQRIAARLDFSADSLLNLLADPATLSPYNLTPEQAIALFIDDSYEVYWSATPEDIVKKIGDNYNRVWNNERREKASRLGLSPLQVATVCSIVDEETNKLDEKGRVGRLYINRLNIGMPLQADPTIRFALNDFTIRRVKGDHLKVESPFNTYRNKGLPPAPIRTSNVATIDEVLNSSPSDDLYMCASEDFSGHHNFAHTYSEHQANARRYQNELNRRGIK